MTVRRRRCSKGIGRNTAVGLARADFVAIVDTDVIYTPEARRLASLWISQYGLLAIDAPFLGLYPRALWGQVGGRRALNVYEDADMWWRIHALGRMRWCPLDVGKNMKEPYAFGGLDHLSSRYSATQRIIRIFRREWDLWKTREYEGKDLVGTVLANTIRVDFGKRSDFQLTNRPPASLLTRALVLTRFLTQALRS